MRKAKKMKKVYHKMSSGTVDHPLLHDGEPLAEANREIAIGDCDAETLVIENV